MRVPIGKAVPAYNWAVFGVKLGALAVFVFLTNFGFAERVALLRGSHRWGTLVPFIGVWGLSLAALLIAAFQPSRWIRAFWAGLLAFSGSIAYSYRLASGSELTVFDAISLWGARHEVNRAAQLLDLMGLSSYREHYPRQLSGGQQSRVAIARALILEPAILLMDEPFAALDAITREELQNDLLGLCRARKTTVFFVTHDITEAVYLADRVAVMEGGRICKDVAVDLPQPRGAELRYSPRFNEICAQLRHAMNGASA